MLKINQQLDINVVRLKGEPPLKISKTFARNGGGFLFIHQ